MTIQTDDFTPAPAKRVISAAPVSPQEEALERALRPKLLQEYVGQAKAREQLEIFIGAAKKREEALDHVLLFGPPGLGKTTLSHIIATELGVQLRQTSGPVLEKPKDLAALPGRADEDFQLLARLGLAHILGQQLGAQGTLQRLFARRFGHGGHHPFGGCGGKVVGLNAHENSVVKVQRFRLLSASLMPSLTPTSAGRALRAAAASLSL